MLDIIDEFVLSGGEEIILSGGLEPFTSELSIPIIEYCGEKNLSISIYTNGISEAFNEDSELRKILKNIRKIRFSINAIEPETAQSH
jgi:MoaA/NifB/PqqE/SkfB family radical SAM enzyme